eukprot:1154536-Pelagomonas_calceolata.AAC.5
MHTHTHTHVLSSTQQQHLVESLLSSAMRGLPQLPLASITGEQHSRDAKAACLLSALARLGYRCRDSNQNPVAQVRCTGAFTVDCFAMQCKHARAGSPSIW